MMIMFDVGVLLLVVLAACDRPNETDQTNTVIEAPSPSSSFVENSTETAGIKAFAPRSPQLLVPKVVAVASTLADKADTEEPQPAVVAPASRPASRADLNVTVKHHEFTSNGVVADVGGGGGYTGAHDSITGALLEKTNDKGTETDRDEEDQVIAAAKLPPADVDSSLADKTEREKPQQAVAEAASSPGSFAETHVVNPHQNGDVDGNNTGGYTYLDRRTTDISYHTQNVLLFQFLDKRNTVPMDKWILVRRKPFNQSFYTCSNYRIYTFQCNTLTKPYDFDSYTPTNSTTFRTMVKELRTELISNHTGFQGITNDYDGLTFLYNNADAVWCNDEWKELWKKNVQALVTRLEMAKANA